MAILQARIADVKKMADQHTLGCRVLVMRRWPRGFARTNVDIWLPDAGPSSELLHEYQEGLIEWSQFEERYKWEQADRQQCRRVVYASGQRISDSIMPRSPRQVLSELEQWHKTVTVMCWEDSCQCHRHILVDMARVRA